MQAVVIVVILVVLLAAATLRRWIVPRYVVVQQYQRGVLSDRGVYQRTLDPGAYWIPKWKMATLVDIRRQVLNVAGQEVLTSDGLSIKVSITGEYSVKDPQRSLFHTVQPTTNLYLYAQSALREVMASLTFDEVMQGRQELDDRLVTLVKPQAAELGLETHSLQIRDIMLSGELKRAFAQAITAQKEGKAALERARGETAALRSLANAAKLMDESPALLQLRALQTMEAGKSNTLVLGMGERSITVVPKS